MNVTMNVTIIGTGYVGLTTALTLAHLGHRVTCLDVDTDKIARLTRSEAPFHEPGLEEMLARVGPSMRFTSDSAIAVSDAELIVISVGTPPLPDGSTDLQYVKAAAHAVGQHLGPQFTTVINKSTVPVGSGNLVEMLVREGLSGRTASRDEARFAVASNPEFLREGSALHDSFYPDRIVIGSDSAVARDAMLRMYLPLIEQSFPEPPGLPRPATCKKVPVVNTDLASAELIKYAANAFLSLKISFINEMAELSEHVGGDIARVAEGIGLDTRIGARFLQPGIGWGGSCFGKDTAALISTASEYGLTLPTVAAAREVNYRQRGRVVSRLLSELKTLKGRTIGLLGLAFKPHTDDVRDAPAFDIARRLIGRGARVRAHDPVAGSRARIEHADLPIVYCDSPVDVAREADALVLITEWPEYGKVAWAEVARVMRSPLILDGRNALDREALTAAGFRYLGVGR